GADRDRDVAGTAEADLQRQADPRELERAGGPVRNPRRPERRARPARGGDGREGRGARGRPLRARRRLDRRAGAVTASPPAGGGREGGVREARPLRILFLMTRAGFLRRYVSLVE